MGLARANTTRLDSCPPSHIYIVPGCRRLLYSRIVIVSFFFLTQPEDALALMEKKEKKNDSFAGA